MKLSAELGLGLLAIAALVYYFVIKPINDEVKSDEGLVSGMFSSAASVPGAVVSGAGQALSSIISAVGGTIQNPEDEDSDDGTTLGDALSGIFSVPIT